MRSVIPKIRSELPEHWTTIDRTTGSRIGGRAGIEARTRGASVFDLRSFVVLSGLALEPFEEILETWNGAEGHLPIEFHYYEGAHAGSEAARAKMAHY